MLEPGCTLAAVVRDADLEVKPPAVLSRQAGLANFHLGDFVGHAPTVRRDVLRQGEKEKQKTDSPHYPPYPEIASRTTPHTRSTWSSRMPG